MVFKFKVLKCHLEIGALGGVLEMVIPRDPDLPYLGWGSETSVSYKHPEGFYSKWSEITLLRNPEAVGEDLNSEMILPCASTHSHCLPFLSCYLLIKSLL